MTDRLYAKPISQGLWQWRIANGNGAWIADAYSTGDAEALASALPSATTPVTLIVPGADIVTCKADVNEADKKHLSKLLPFELEERIITPVEDIHLVHGQIEDEKVDAYYIRAEKFNEFLAPLLELGVEVTEAVPDYSLLKHSDNGITVFFDGDMVVVRVADKHGFSVEAQLAKTIFPRLKIDLDQVTQLSLVAEEFDLLENIHGWLPEIWEEDFEISLNENHYWDWLDLTRSSRQRPNLRVGDFAKRLPIERWVTLWKMPAALVASVFFVSVIVIYGQYLVAKSEFKEIRQTSQKVFQDAVPNGRRGDEERQLRALLAGKSQNDQQPTNLMVLLSKMSKVITSMDSVKLANFRYTGEQRELLVNVEVKSLSDLNKFRQDLAAVGLESGSPRSTAQGEIYQAQMKVTEKN